jgi:uncharacterized protein YdeI (YjbR/CyaY-like superfamily)
MSKATINEHRIKFFKTQAAFRKWLMMNHAKASEQWVGFYRKSTGIPSITWPQSVDEALCFGWIDGLRKGIDDLSYKIRFSPRKDKSIWSTLNIKRAKELIELGLMQPAGRKIFEDRDEEKANRYSFEQKKITLHPAFEKELKANKKAWKYFSKMPASYRKPAMWWVVSAKREETRLNRLKILINDSAAGKKIKPLSF